MDAKIKDMVFDVLTKTALSGAQVTGVVIGFRMLDGKMVFNGQGVTPQEFVDSVKALERGGDKLLINPTKGQA